MSKRPASEGKAAAKKAKTDNYKDEIVSNPLFLFFSDTLIAMDNRVNKFQKELDRMAQEKRVLTARLTGTQQYILELECRLENVTETLERLIDREGFHVRDAVQTTIEQMMLENGPNHVGADDLEELLERFESDMEGFEEELEHLFEV